MTLKSFIPSLPSPVYSSFSFSLKPYNDISPLVAPTGFLSQPQWLPKLIFCSFCNHFQFDHVFFMTLALPHIFIIQCIKFCARYPMCQNEA